MPFFSTDLAVLDASVLAFQQQAESHVTIADQVQSGAQVRPNLGDLSVTASFQQTWYGWVQTRFEDLLAAAGVLATASARLAETAQAYAEADRSAACALDEIAVTLGAGPR